MIWFDGIQPTLDAANLNLDETILGRLGIRMVEIGDDYIRGTMPVDARTHQPYGLLHGGASVVLAESLGSIGAALCVDRDRYRVVGLEVNANHLRAVRDGQVTGTAKPIHLGRTTQVWGIEIVNEAGKKTCVCRLTMAVIDTKPQTVDQR
jgi:1,4-dihydroxy-2-naphthoyl-CoA hydrolase